MKKLSIYSIFLIPLIFVLAYQVASFSQTEKPREENEPLKFEVTSDILLAEVPRIGLNLGGETTWGAGQLLSNVIINPGCEGTIHRVIISLNEFTKDQFYDPAEWRTFPNGFWKGARYEIRTGKFAGTQGIIKDSLEKGPKGLSEYITEGPLPPVEKNDIIIVTQETPESEWWINEQSKGRVLPAPGEHRPDSPGTQSLAFIPHTNHAADVYYHLDNDAEKTGKMLPINGKWRFSVWVRADGEKEGVLEVAFVRIGSRPFLHKQIKATSKWEKHTFDFDALDDGPAAILKLRLAAHGEDTRLLVDDIELGQIQSLTFPFRKEVVDALKKLQPGYLRDLRAFANAGNTLENFLAPSFARKCFKIRPAKDTSDYEYSLPDFLKLCEVIQAQPWIVVPVTFSDDDYEMLGRYLAEPANSIFHEIVVEFGNENWNWATSFAGIAQIPQHGEMAERAFKKIMDGAGNTKNFIKAVNGQYANPDNALKFAASSPSAQLLGIAPYYLHSLDPGLSPEQCLIKLFDQEGIKLLQEIAKGAKAMGKEVGVYEVNAHTNQGMASPDERNPIVAGTASGTALANRILLSLQQGYKRQAIFALSGYETGTPNHNVRLWGIMRDLGSTQRFRPTGLATIMLNKVVEGNLHRVIATNQIAKKNEKYLTIAPFLHSNRWTAAIASSYHAPLEVELTFNQANSNSLPHHLLLIQSDSPFDTNEEKENVKIIQIPTESDNQTVRFVIPSWGFIVLVND